MNDILHDRSVAVVTRGRKILMEKVRYYGREFFTVPGGGIEPGETPEQTVIRELKEECGVDGVIVRPLAVQYRPEGNVEYSFEVRIPEEQTPILGYDPEEPVERPALLDVLWMTLDEISARDRAFLWGYGLLNVEGFLNEIP